MKIYRLSALVLLPFVLLACSANIPASPTAHPTSRPVATITAPPLAIADIIFINGDIITMDTANPSAEAVAVLGDRILAVGTNEEALYYQGDLTVIVDLAGHAMMPGFVDAHNHMLGEHLLYDEDPLPDQQMAIENGITTSAEFYVDQSILNKFKTLAEARQLRMRLNLYLLHTSNCGEIIGDWWKAYQPNQQIAPNLYVRGIKIFADGGSCKAPAMSVAYPGGGKGDLFFTQEQLNQMVREVDEAGFQVAIHALGDRAVEQAQNAIASALDGRSNTYRHRIEHNATIRPELLPRYGEIGIVPVIFGSYSTCIRSTGESKKFKYILSEEYGAWDWPWRALVDANPALPIAWQSDYPIFNTINPFDHMWGMVTRKQVNTDGSICDPPDWLAAGALRIDEVLPMMTINSAYSLFFDDDIGSLKSGKLADLVILSNNPLHVGSDQLKDIKVQMSMIDGRVEWCAPGDEAMCPSASVTLPSTAQPASNPKVTASAELAGEPAANAFDGSIDTDWNSGNDPEQWIQIDLGDPQTISAIRLTVAQHPEGQTIHQIWGGDTESSLRLLHEFHEFTAEFQVLTFEPATPMEHMRIIRVVTKQSPSWVAWREIEVIE
jgi:Predicted metal-dependent hydrolase with the TIM-barrel fold